MKTLTLSLAVAAFLAAGGIAAAQSPGAVVAPVTSPAATDATTSGTSAAAQQKAGEAADKAMEAGKEKAPVPMETKPGMPAEKH